MERRQMVRPILHLAVMLHAGLSRAACRLVTPILSALAPQVQMESIGTNMEVQPTTKVLSIGLPMAQVMVVLPYKPLQ